MAKTLLGLDPVPVYMLTAEIAWFSLVAVVMWNLAFGWDHRYAWIIPVCILVFMTTGLVLSLRAILKKLAFTRQIVQ